MTVRRSDPVCLRNSFMGTVPRQLRIIQYWWAPIHMLTTFIRPVDYIASIMLRLMSPYGKSPSWHTSIKFSSYNTAQRELHIPQTSWYLIWSTSNRSLARLFWAAMSAIQPSITMSPFGLCCLRSYRSNWRTSFCCPIHAFYIKAPSCHPCPKCP